MDLWPVYGSQREIKVSLGTRDPAVAKSRFAAKTAEYDQEFEAKRRAYRQGASQRITETVRTFLDERNAKAAANWDRIVAALDLPGDGAVPIRAVTLEEGADPASIGRAIKNAPGPSQARQLADEDKDALREAADDFGDRGSWVHSFAHRLAMFEDAAAFAATNTDPDPDQKSAMAGAALTIATTMAMSGTADVQARTRHVVRRQMLESSSAARTLPGVETIGRLAASGNMAPIDRLIRDVGRRLGQTVMGGDDLYQAIGQALYAEMICRLAHEDHAITLTVSPTTVPPVTHQPRVGGQAPHAVAAGGKHSMRDVLEDWIAKTSPKIQTRLEWQSSLSLFDRIVGPVAIEDLTEDHIFEFQSVLKDLPPMRGKMEWDADLKEIARTNSGTKVSSASVNKRVTAIRTLRRHAGSKMRLTLAPVDPDSRVTPLPLANGGGIRNPIRVEELNHTLLHPVSDALPADKRASIFWLLLLGTFTGARLGELLQLSIDDMFVTEGVLCIAVVNDPDDDTPSAAVQGSDGQEKARKSLKTSNAKREIPVHPQLIAAGFQEFVQGRKQRGYQDLFQDIPLAKGRRTNKGSLLVNNHVRAAGLADTTKVFHSLRHSFRQRLESRIQKAMLNYLMGHAPGSVGERYAHGGLVSERQNAIAQLDYSQMDLEQIRQIARSHIW